MDEKTKIRITQIIFYLFSILCFVERKAIPLFNKDIFICITICSLSYLLGRDLYRAYLFFIRISKLRMKRNIVYLIISSILIAFSLVGNDCFYDFNMGYMAISTYGLISFFYIFLYSIVLCLVVNYWFSKKIKLLSYEKNQNKAKKDKYCIFLLLVISGVLYLIAFNPANMFPDSYRQLKQIFGHEPYYDWHPVFHTLLLKVFLNICDTPAFFVVFHIILFAYVMTKWLTKLRAKGLNNKIIFIFVFSFYINIAYGLLITNIWKDNIYNIFIIWISYLLYDMLDNFAEFDKNIWNYVFLMICLGGIYYTRHNGIIPVVAIVIFLTIYMMKIKSKKIIKIYAFVFFMIFFKIFIYKDLNVIPNDNGVKYIPIVHDISSVLSYNDGESLSSDVKEEMFSILPLDIWKIQYNATDSDSYTFYTDDFLKNLNSKRTSEMLKLYIKSFSQEPGRIFFARLMSSQLLWSTFKRVGSMDYLYEKVNTLSIEQEFGYKRSENNLTYLGHKIYEVFEKVDLLNTIFYRTGIWFILLIICIFIGLVNMKRKKILLTLIPIGGNIFSLLLVMTVQHLRYVWSVFLVSILFCFLLLCEENDFNEV